LDVVVIDAILVAVTLEKVNRVNTSPIFEVNTALRKDLLHSLDKLIYEGEQVLG
jgi:hypothetical protein